MKIGFLFNHHTAHQVLHGAPIAFALSLLAPEAEVTIFASRDELMQMARDIGGGYGGHRVTFETIPLPWWSRPSSRLLQPVWLVEKPLTTHFGLPFLEGLDALVVPEKTSLTLKPRLPGTRFVHTRHGAGDRAVGYDARSAQFDLVLAAGRKVRDRLVATGLPAERCAVVGYPKFDAVNRLRPTPRVFTNGRPTVLYNPHFAKRSSSWPRFGLKVLDFFCRRPDLNLIFAPHVLLWARPWRHGARSLAKYRNRSNIHLDTGSRRSIDMSYTREADIYLGDVSSQIYEFLERPRPCIFLNAHGVDWRDDPNYRFWQAGPVLDDLTQLSALVDSAGVLSGSFTEAQKELFSETFELTREPSAERAARAILGMLQS